MNTDITSQLNDRQKALLFRLLGEFYGLKQQGYSDEDILDGLGNLIYSLYGDRPQYGSVEKALFDLIAALK